MTRILKITYALLQAVSFLLSFCLYFILGLLLIFLDLNVMAVERLTRLRRPMSDRIALLCTLVQGALFFATLSLSSSGGLMMMVSSRFENLSLITTFKPYRVTISVEFNLLLLCQALLNVLYHLLIITFLILSNIMLCLASFPFSFVTFIVGLVFIMSQL